MSLFIACKTLHRTFWWGALVTTTITTSTSNGRHHYSTVAATSGATTTTTPITTIAPIPPLPHPHPHHVVTNDNRRSEASCGCCHLTRGGIIFAPHIYKIGVTGGIACGKSSLLRLLKKTYSNMVFLDCDKLAHETYNPGMKAYDAIVSSFGRDRVVDPNTGYIDRDKLSRIVFSHDPSLCRLNRIVWPELVKYLKKKILCSEAQGFSMFFLEAALLFEAGFTDYVDEVWTLGVPSHEALRRVMERGLTAHEALSRINHQLGLEQRRKRCDFFIDSFNLSKEENATRVFARIDEIERKLLREEYKHHHLIHEVEAARRGRGDPTGGGGGDRVGSAFGLGGICRVGAAGGFDGVGGGTDSGGGGSGGVGRIVDCDTTRCDCPFAKSTET